MNGFEKKNLSLSLSLCVSQFSVNWFNSCAYALDWAFLSKLYWPFSLRFHEKWFAILCDSNRWICHSLFLLKKCLYFWSHTNFLDLIQYFEWMFHKKLIISYILCICLHKKNCYSNRSKNKWSSWESAESVLPTERGPFLSRNISLSIFRFEKHTDDFFLFL